MQYALQIIICIYFLSAFRAVCQVPEQPTFDTTEVTSDTLNRMSDSVPDTKTNFWNAQPHSPKKAALFALVPGLGQAYNKKYWKIPIVYTALGVSGYAIWFNAYYYNDLKDAYLIRTDGDSTTTDEYVTLIPSEASLLQYAEYYKKNLDLSVIIFSAVYILNIVDAVVDAHLFSFDISDDLSLQIKPYYNLSDYNSFAMSNNAGASYGLKFKLNLK